MPYARCPMPYALCPVIPHMRARKAIVAFIDIWKYEIKWAGYGQIIPGIADNQASKSHGLSPQVILADLVRRLAQQMDITINNITGLFFTLLRLGWYKIEF